MRQRVAMEATGAPVHEGPTKCSWAMVVMEELLRRRPMLREALADLPCTPGHRRPRTLLRRLAKR
ncbi:unnamed protein product [Cladocopium goreaui]|uniref:Uncharacterized protein n=1 Tax=Cladocopium goreaui TaxID=2562237 RepID=A0A9P1FK05_9DINO|nr:unnamed protein product [Cladocopium goreaui]